MEPLEEMARLGRYIHANYPIETKQIAEVIGNGNIIDVAILLLEHLDEVRGEINGN